MNTINLIKIWENCQFFGLCLQNDTSASICSRYSFYFTVSTSAMGAAGVFIELLWTGTVVTVVAHWLLGRILGIRVISTVGFCFSVAAHMQWGPPQCSCFSSQGEFATHFLVKVSCFRVLTSCAHRKSFSCGLQNNCQNMTVGRFLPFLGVFLDGASKNVSLV